MIDSGEVPRGEKMLLPGTDPESHITKYTSVYEDKQNMHRFLVQNADYLHCMGLYPEAPSDADATMPLLRHSMAEETCWTH